MTSLKHLIHFLLLYIVLGLSSGKDIDPEMQLCEDLSIDAAVTADDNIGYAFKGDFYWTMSTTDGISSNTIARYIKNRWKGLSGPIDAAFTIETNKEELGTVFMKGNQWFFYKMEKLVKNGTTDKWSNFKAPVLSAFEWYNSSLDRKDYLVTFFYDVNKFSKYVFHDIESPEFLVMSKTWVGGNFLSFFYEPFTEVGGLMSDFITPRAVISDTTQFVIIGDRNLCKADITDNLGPLCNPINDTTVINNFYGCPRKPFPTTTTTTSTTKAPPKNAVTKGNTNKNNGITSVEGNDRSDTDVTSDEDRNKTFDGINDGNSIETTVGGNSGQQNSVEPIDNSKTSPNDGQTVDDLSTTPTKDEDRQSLFKTWFTWIVAIVIICLILFVLILFAICFYKRCQTNETFDKESAKPEPPPPAPVPVPPQPAAKPTEAKKPPTDEGVTKKGSTESMRSADNESTGPSTPKANPQKDPTPPPPTTPAPDQIKGEDF